MESFSTTKIGSVFNIEGLPPDTIKVVRIDNQEAREVAEMTLHRSDLCFALQCVESINLVPAESYIVKKALWHSAIVHYAKCFQRSAARTSLMRSEVYSGDSGAVVAFDYFMNLRNKHVGHDENSYSQSLPGAAINNGNKSFKIEKILCMAVEGETLEKANCQNLHLLISDALKYVDIRIDSLCVKLTKRLEKENYHELINRPPPEFKAPELNEISKRR